MIHNQQIDDIYHNCELSLTFLEEIRNLEKKDVICYYISRIIDCLGNIKGIANDINSYIMDQTNKIVMLENGFKQLELDFDDDLEE